MTMRYRNQTIMYNDTKDAPATQDTASQDNIPLNGIMPKQDGESSTKYSKDPDPYHDLAELQEHFQQLQE